MRRTKTALLIGGLLIARACGTRAEEPAKPAMKHPTTEALLAEIEGLQAAKVAWREIAWKSCLLEGLQESRAQNKPALLWIFIDRPADDARC